MRDVKTAMNDIRIAMETDKMLQKNTSHFKTKSILLDSVIDSLYYASLNDIMDICMEFPSLKNRLIKLHEKRKIAEAAEVKAWASADMNNPSNR